MTLQLNVPTSQVTAVRSVALGALLGLTWAAGLRGWMTHVAGDESRYTWIGTFVCLLLPGLLTGGLLGLAQHLRQSEQRPPWARWLICSPLLFPVGVLAIPGAIPHLLRTGEGSSSIAVVLLAMLGAYALAGRGPKWWRIVCGVIGFALVPAMLAGTLSTPKNAWGGILFACMYVLLALACTIPLHLREQ
ncbi:hypothetical protein GCM10029976_041980 [Kribbella albertanoniae]|uniref:Uncharacterized protein n=1 Tax=Kribbella albertanoniae TaxID=1266829 RepID=A0A4R4QFR3_9ACTN|nr:hypothetical protein [Kribbella albertanoniae]TDC33992.1 hypothetical protein E1261_04595 [Kribbella albertanoniae]